MSSIEQPDMLKEPSRHSWLIFAVGIGLVPVGGIIWTAMTGVSPWLSPRRHEADRIMWVFLISAYALCVVAPLFARTSLLRRLGYCVLAAAAVFAVQLVCAVIHLLLIGV
jgi:hypothetical protein